MKRYIKEVVVSKDDLDELQHVNNVRYVQWIQDIAKEHWEQAAPKNLRSQVMWVVQKHEITYKNAAKLGDVITLKTHIEENRGATSVRVVEMFQNKTNSLLVRSKTTWCLLNSKTARPSRISDEIKALFV